VVDNCEHLLDACAHLAAALLGASRSLTVLTTSREPLRLGGELAWRVPSLSAPDEAATVAPENVMRAEAVRLFVARAELARPGFAVTSANVAAVAEVCRRLDGIPLAIELAAARVVGLSVEQIAARLDQRFRLLTGGSRAALPRQQTLRATLDWSHDLLTEPERALLRRLAVFAGGWLVEAAEAVVADEGLDAAEVLDLLLRLVDRSLVQAEPGVSAETRYRLLETVRQYGLERLREAGEAEAVRDRHLRWYVDLAERAEPALRGRELVVWLDRLEAEHGNIRAALHWARERGAADLGLRVAGALTRAPIWRRRSPSDRCWASRGLPPEPWPTWV
jgi:non-specific serine/threonine protein kinase